MRILHLSLGLPPFRTGGLNRYCADLMEQQVKDGVTVALLYPGEFMPGGKTDIRKEKHGVLELFRIINPLPLALTNGIAEPGRYMKPGPMKVYQSFLEKIAPDVIHVHTLQGFHKELFEAAKILKIRIVFTTHDYYPFCPKCTLLDRIGMLCTGNDGEKCARCNAGCGLSHQQEVVMQSRLYMKLKYHRLVSKMRRRQRELNNSRVAGCKNGLGSGIEYDKLSAFYREIMGMMDLVHANSDISLQAYQQAFPELRYCMKPITHAGIEVHSSAPPTGIMSVIFLGGKDQYKGLDVLLCAMELLDKQGMREWNLWLYGADFAEYCTDSRIYNGGYYDKKQEASVWKHSNPLLIVPSKWLETFGFVVLEGLAQGVPVICSDLVGAKLLVPKDNVFPHGDANALANKIQHHSNQISLKNEMVSMKSHSDEIFRHIYEL